ncbi:hypothetical protein ACFONN_02865 [Dyella humi]|uniref:Uncharacterized protein n=1 Tax=Dyella humi TaxID=1770547 RepID=A0ABW8IFT2_9GAMM
MKEMSLGIRVLRMGYHWNSVVNDCVDAGYDFLGSVVMRGVLPDDMGIGLEQQQTRSWLLGATSTTTSSNCVHRCQRWLFRRAGCTCCTTSRLAASQAVTL